MSAHVCYRRHGDAALLGEEDEEFTVFSVVDHPYPGKKVSNKLPITFNPYPRVKLRSVTVGYIYLLWKKGHGIDQLHVVGIYHLLKAQNFPEFLGYAI